VFSSYALLQIPRRDDVIASMVAGFVVNEKKLIKKRPPEALAKEHPRVMIGTGFAPAQRLASAD